MLHLIQRMCVGLKKCVFGLSKNRVNLRRSFAIRFNLFLFFKFVKLGGSGLNNTLRYGQCLPNGIIISTTPTAHNATDENKNALSTS